VEDDHNRGEAHKRWEGRNADKDMLRKELWGLLESNEVNVGPVHGKIPNFVGADAAAERLAAQPFWKASRVVKSNPDDAQIPVRLRALRDGKLLYMPVPELVNDLPFLELDPRELERNGVSFETAARIPGAMAHGKRVRFEEMQPMDVLVVGCVAVTPKGGRTGKGGGFADLELGLFREVGTIRPTALIMTTVHDLQVVTDDRIVMQPHDSPLDWIITPKREIETRTTYPQPKGVDWTAIQPDQYRDIPFLRELRKQFEHSQG